MNIILDAAFFELKQLWKDNRLVGTHREDVEKILIKLYRASEGKDLVVVRANDWSVLYVDGADKWQNHDIDIREFGFHAPIKSIEYLWASDGMEEYLATTGRFPVTLSEYLERENVYE